MTPAERHEQREQYERLGRRWSQAEARAAYEATPACNWAMVFWTAVAAKLGRTHDATYKQLGVRWGWPAKVAEQPERVTICTCSDCGGPKPVSLATRCRACYLATLVVGERRSRVCVDCGAPIKRYGSTRCRVHGAMAQWAARA